MRVGILWFLLPRDSLGGYDPVFWCSGVPFQSSPVFQRAPLSWAAWERSFGQESTLPQSGTQVGILSVNLVPTDTFQD